MSLTDSRSSFRFQHSTDTGWEVESCLCSCMCTRAHMRAHTHVLLRNQQLQYLTTPISATDFSYTNSLAKSWENTSRWAAPRRAVKEKVGSKTLQSRAKHKTPQNRNSPLSQSRRSEYESYCAAQQEYRAGWVLDQSFVAFNSPDVSANYLICRCLN